MRILFIATRSPYPPRDGGGALMAATIDGLASLGHHIHVIAPRFAGQPAPQSALPSSVELQLVQTRRRSLPAALASSALTHRPLSVERHSQPIVSAAVRELVGRMRFDVVHVEQPQALLQGEPALEAGLPVIMRAQNVESDLWKMLARARPRWRLLALREARSLANWEAAAVQRVQATVALTANDAGSLERLAPGGRVRVIRMPMAAELPAADRELSGSPPIVLLASGGWFPNRDGVGWFLKEIWPEVSRALPDAQLHIFGFRERGATAGIRHHPAPLDSRDAFAPNSILLVPLRIASGARVKILEAWARGVPVVATPPAASGLDVADGRGLLVARTADEFAGAFSALTSSNERMSVVLEGREILRRSHDPKTLALALEELYADAMRASGARAD